MKPQYKCSAMESTNETHEKEYGQRDNGTVDKSRSSLLMLVANMFASQKNICRMYKEKLLFSENRKKSDGKKEE